MIRTKDECVAYLDHRRSKTVLRKVIQDLLREWEVKHYFAAIHTIETTSAICPERKILVVDEKLLSWGTPAVQGMVLHEIAHLDRGHILGDHEEELANHVDEYEADEFAFDAMQTMYGYIPLSTGLWMLETIGTWRWDCDTFTHPSLEHRWERLAWNGFVPADASVTHQALGLVEPKEYYG